MEVAGGRHETFDGFVEVLNKEYPVESIWLPKTKSKIRGKCTGLFPKLYSRFS